MKNFAITFLFVLSCLSRTAAQLPNGTVAPDFTATDINGVSHNLYTLLNQGKTVFIDFSATWCGICWNYHNSNALKNLWNTYGPPGTNEAYVLFVESYQPSNTNCLFGASGCNNSTLGNWVTGTPYPIIDNSTIGDLFQVSFYPVVICICPADKKQYAVGTLSMNGLWNARNANCATALQVATTSITPVTCFGSNTGAVDLTVSGGSSPYTYNWSNGATTQDLLNIAAGTYTCTVTAANGTTTTTPSIAVTGPTAPLTIAQTSYTEPTCNGILATITTTSSGGWAAGGYTYLWSNGQTTPTAANLNPGTYTITVTDNRGCTQSLTASAGAPVLPTVIIAPPTSITCAQSTVQLNGSGSSAGGNFSYSWMASNGGNITGGNSSPIATANASGTYTLVVTNTTTTCTQSAVSTVTENTVPPTAVASTPGTLNCQVNQLQLSGEGSSTGNNFNFNWTTTNGFIISGQNTISPLVNLAGNYQLVVTNTNNGCTAATSTAVIQNPPVTAAVASSMPVSCFGGANGATLINAGGGTGVFSYLWNNGATTQSLTGLSAGNYTATVSDNINCTTTVNIIIDQPNALLPNAVATAQTIVNLNDGTATALPSGGTPGYSYTWNTGATANTINNLPPGSYTVTITDANNCTAVQTVVVNAYNCAISGNLTSQNLLCANSATGAVSITLSGGTAPFTYLWNTGATTSGMVGLSAGAYTVTATDAAGCIVTESALLTQASPINVNAVATGQTQVGVNNGTASASPTGGTPGYTYLWSNSATTADITGLAPGNYTVTVTDNNGCTAIQNIIINTFNCAIAAQPTVVFASCADQPNGQIALNVTGGTPPFTHLWSNGDTTAALQNVLPGNYSITLTDNSGCQITAMYAIGVNDAIAPTITCPSAIRACPSNSAAQFDQPAAADNCGNTGLEVAQIAGLPSGAFFPMGTTLQVFRATDASGNTASCSFEVIVSPPVNFDSIVVTDATNNQNNGAIDMSISGGTPPYNYFWTNSSGQLVGTTEDISDLAAGFYAVKVVDLFGCSFFFAVEVKQVTTTQQVPAWLQGYSLTPNPATGFFTFKLNQLPVSPIKISIRNNAGQVIHEELVHQQWQTNIHCQSWPTGVYSVAIQSEEGLFYTRLVVAH